MVRRLWLSLPLAALLALSAAASAQVDAPALFAANCAKCHGLDGSGTGPTVLDRPARNFKEGGFSFGNTPEVIARTIAHGIPGSPMPTFEGALSDAQLQALAAYVVTLGPPVKEVGEAETLMHVTDRPLVVRGILPPLEEGGKVIPRGLLIGTPDGLTFEYAADEVRLLAVRMGDFVKRTDWGERGGTPLEPLGKVVWLAPTLASESTWEVARHISDNPPQPRERLRARLLSTTALTQPFVSYSLVSEGAAAQPFGVRAAIAETVLGAKLGEYAGFTRRFEVTPMATGTGVILQLPTSTALFTEPSGRADDNSWWAQRIDENSGEVRHLVAETAAVGVLPGGSVQVEFSAARAPLTFSIETFVLSPWDSETLARLREIAQ